ncbi:MAG: tRNA (guanosine(46)-N7)-methyltransferase TrmB [Muribaculaceae bacterium]|nr:tRNA (guanosine(46)-N7)-methyltransferase TrmB [Muribaculaceae bacterium]
MNKLQKFAEMATMPNVIQCPRPTIEAGAFPYKGRWSDSHFGERRPIVLELGCGKGEYTVRLAQNEPERSFIGIDIKGARMYTGARLALDENIDNVAFLRTECELLGHFFDEGEIDEIWITFPDPQMKKVNKRLTSARFLDTYRRLLRPGGIINLKTDSPFLFEFTRRIIDVNGLVKLTDTPDLYADMPAGTEDARRIQTAYECQWLSRGKTIKYLRFAFPADADLSTPPAPLVNPREDDIDKDDYRAYPRGNEVANPLINKNGLKS